MNKIGIPRGLYYFEAGDIWQTFLESLGYDVVLSQPTDRTLLEEGCRDCTSGACLPVKAYHGHVKSLLEEDVDCVLLPRVVRPFDKAYSCPKVIGVNDMIRSSLKPGVRTVEPALRGSLLDFCVETGCLLGCRFFAIKEAYAAAKQKSDELFSQKEASASEGTLKIALLGHPYLLYDSVLNLNIASILRSLGCEVLYGENMDRALLRELSRDGEKKLFWACGEQNVGFERLVAREGGADGVICLTSFGCGPDAFLMPKLRETAQKNGLSFLVLSFDEHSAEEGMRTRLEAFTDLIRRKKEGKHA